MRNHLTLHHIGNIVPSGTKVSTSLIRPEESFDNVIKDSESDVNATLNHEGYMGNPRSKMIRPLARVQKTSVGCTELLASRGQNRLSGVTRQQEKCDF